MCLGRYREREVILKIPDKWIGDERIGVKQIWN